MYQPYPSGDQQPVAPPGPPQPVRTAVLLMYAGAALSAIEIIIGLVTISSLKNAIRSRYPGYTSSQLHTAEVVGVTTVVVIGLIGVGLWLWMAWANGRGRNWARVLSAVFFGISTFDLFMSFFVVRATATMIVGLVIWLVGLAAIVLLFSPESAPFFRGQPAG